MYIFFIGLFLIAFQVTCQGAPGPLFSVRVPWRPAYAFREEKYIEKRDLCTDDQRDRSVDCGEWAASGHCESSEGYEFMQENCYASCGNCEAPVEQVKLDEDVCLQAHNAKRARHQNTPALVWDATLAQHAKEWADHLAEIGDLQHEAGSGEGENLYWALGIAIRSCSDAVEKWFSEEKDYNYIVPGSSSGTGRFTQVVWKGTTYVGVAKTVVDNGSSKETYIVARYSPSGNWHGQYEENVKEKKPGAP